MLYFLGSFLLLLIVYSIIRNSFGWGEGAQRLYYFAAFIIVMSLFVLCDKTMFEDLPDYLDLFNNSKKVSWANLSDLQHYNITDKFEIGWCAYTKLISTIFPDSQALLIITYGIITIGYLSFIKKYSKDVWFSTVLFILLVVYNSIFVLRQNLVMSICFNLYPLIEKRKPIKFFLIIALLFLFHKTVVVFSVMYFMHDTKLNLKYIAVFGIVAFILARYFAPLLLFLSDISNWWVAIDENTITNAASNYMSAFITMAILLYVCFVTKLKNMSSVDWLLLHALVFATIINFARVGFGGTFGRLVQYYTFSLCVLLPNVSTLIIDKPIRYGCVAVIITLYCISLSSAMNYGYTW